MFLNQTIKSYEYMRTIYLQLENIITLMIQ